MYSVMQYISVAAPQLLIWGFWKEEWSIYSGDSGWLVEIVVFTDNSLNFITFYLSHV